MKNTLSRIILIVASISIAVGFWSCEDRIDYPDSYYEEGISTIDVNLDFKDFTPALGNSRSAGKAIKAINDLWFVIYNGDRNFVEKRHISPDSIKITENERPDGSASSETKTGHAVVKLTIPNGHYYIYAVANLDLTGVSDQDLSSIEKLKAMPLKWQSTYSNDSTWQSPNGQMLGGFKPMVKKDNKDSEAEKVTINSSSTKLHAWLTRAASKVTIAFDTRNLNDDVRLYIKSIQIKDIPQYCPLGMDNAPGQDNMPSYEHNNLTDEQRKSLIDGEIFYFGSAKEGDDPKTQHNGWRIIASGDTIYGLSSEYNKIDTRNKPYQVRWELEHSESAPALYFYENRQPDGIEGTVSDKRQDVDGNNKVVSYPNGYDSNDVAWKDGMPYGTYIEVKGYYENEGTKRPGKGEITYRFMLGKDHIKNYDSERNHHYRLTMKFNGYANDVDFHIDYREEAKPGLHVQETTYVSYLYNQECHTTIRATPREGYDILKLEAYIVDNEWRPYDVPAGQEADMYNKSAWDWQMNLSNSYGSTAGGYSRPDLTVNWTDFAGKKDSFKAANNIEFGFLSLRKTRNNIYELGGGGDKGTFVAKMRKLFFDSNPEGSNTYTKANSKGYRDYGVMPTSDGTKPGGNDTDGKFKIERKTNKLNGSIDYIMEVPLYTRARSIDSWAVYSGANPFYRHRRYARVVFVATYKKVDFSKAGPDKYQEIGETNVQQAYRIDNPRAIYRRRTNKDPFKVVLVYNMKTAAEQQDTDIPDDEIIYDEIISRGGWTVTIENDPHEMVQIEANGQTIKHKGSITGRNNTPIIFTYTPLKEPAEGDSYGATIFITYHNNSCTHRIIVRQGYDAHEIGPGQTTLWSAFNVYDSGNLTKSPLSVGSTFRTVDLTYPIKESNNLRKGFGVNETPTDALWIHGKTDTAWGSIPSMTSVQTGLGSYTWKLHNKVHDKNYTYRLPDYSELPDIGIYKNKDKTNDTSDEGKKILKIGQAFGICYADGADGVLFTKKAYSYYDPDNKGEDTEAGVRGVVIYSQENADNVFFPFGCLGHPRRRRDGLLQYGSVNFKLTGDRAAANNYRPMAYDLLHQVGGAYWITGSDATHHAAIDYNGGNYMGSYLNKDDVFQTGNTSDALPIKPIIVSKE